MNEYEIYIEEKEINNQVFDGKDIQKFHTKESGACVTVILSNKIGQCILECDNKNAIEWAIKRAYENAKLSTQTKKYDLAHQVDCSTYNVLKNDPYEISDILSYLNKADTIKKISFRQIDSYIRIVNSNSFDNFYNNRFMLLNYTIYNQKTCSTIIGYVLGHSVKEIISNFNRDYCEKRDYYISDINRAVTGKTTCVFWGDALCQLFSHFIKIFIGKKQKKYSNILSLLADNAGDLIIEDNAILEKGYATSPFDAEARISKSKKLVADGKIQGFFWDAEDEKILGVKSSGNMMKNSYCDKAYLCSTNIIINGHIKKKFIDIEGYIISKIIYIPGAINLELGLYSLIVEGYYVKNNNVLFYIPRFKISGSIASFFRTACIMDVTPRWHIGGSVIFTAPVIVSDINVDQL